MADRIEQLQQMLARDPNDAFCLYALGMEYASTGAHEAAAAHLERSLEQDADQPYAYFHRARSLAAIGRRAEAMQAASEGLHCAESLEDEKAVAELAQLQQDLPHP